MTQNDPRLRYKHLFTRDLTALPPEERKLLAREYIARFSDTDIPHFPITQEEREFWKIAQIPLVTKSYAPELSLPSVDEKRIPPKNIEEADELEVELELYELMSRINFCQHLLETSTTASIETYDRLIIQVNYSTSDVEKVLRDQEPDEIIVIVCKYLDSMMAKLYNYLR